jgi:hypothetical protein
MGIATAASPIQPEPRLAGEPPREGGLFLSFSHDREATGMDFKESHGRRGTLESARGHAARTAFLCPVKRSARHSLRHGRIS